ncbi:MAG TPA: PAS domain S-box protein [Chloroflexi bacterium]|nr:PAS domain S-box protein [Chloroflexota bacterium]
MTETKKSSQQSGQQALLRFLDAVWRLLTEPSAALQGLEARRQARVLSGILIPLSLAAFLGLVANPTTPFIRLMLILLIAAYGLSRTRYATLAMVLAIAVGVLPPAGALLTLEGYTQQGIILSAVWLLIPMLLSGILFPPLGTVLVNLAIVGFVLALPALNPSLPFSNILATLGFLISVAPMFLVGSFIRRRDIREVESVRARMENILNTAGEGIITVDSQQRITLFNRQAEELFGYRAEEVLGQPLSLLMPEQFQAAHARHVDHFGQEEAMFRAMGQREVEILGRRKDGSTFPMEVAISKVEVGGEINFTAMLHDITERKKVEEDLRKLSRAAEQSAVSIVITDTSGTIEYVNPKFTEVTGYTREEALGQNPRILKSGKMPPETYKDLWQTITSGRVWRGEFHNRKKNGELYWEAVSIAPVLDASGKVTHYVAVKEDITERKAAEERIRDQARRLAATARDLAIARKRAEEANRLKSEFLSTMSHELRTPLNAIIGYTEIMLAGMTGDLSNEQFDYLKRVLANGENLLNLINNVLDIAKIEAGRMELVQEPIPIRPWLEGVTRQFQILAEEKGLAFTAIVSPDMPDTIVGDPERLKQIATNLISNAVKFTDEGSINVEIDKLADDRWALVVSDTGVGIPSHAQEYIFDEFRQADGSPRRKYGGTGLGLAIVRNLALTMGGNVRLTSKVGEGSTFTVILPLVTQDMTVAQK